MAAVPVRRSPAARESPSAAETSTIVDRPCIVALVPTVARARTMFAWERFVSPAATLQVGTIAERLGTAVAGNSTAHPHVQRPAGHAAKTASAKGRPPSVRQ